MQGFKERYKSEMCLLVKTISNIVELTAESVSRKNEDVEISYLNHAAKRIVCEQPSSSPEINLTPDEFDNPEIDRLMRIVDIAIAKKEEMDKIRLSDPLWNLGLTPPGNTPTIAEVFRTVEKTFPKTPEDDMPAVFQSPTEDQPVVAQTNLLKNPLQGLADAAAIQSIKKNVSHLAMFNLNLYIYYINFFNIY